MRSVIWDALATLAMLAIVGLLITLAIISHAHASMVRVDSATGIPIEWLFGAIGALGLIVYGDMKREMYLLRRENERRVKFLSRLSSVWAIVCQKLDIPWHPDNDRED